ncbi:MAG: reverse transcriptase domain-containing protein, partial [Candidatus Thiodiazotropha sp.]
MEHQLPENEEIDNCQSIEDEYNSFCFDNNLTTDYYEYEQGQKDIIVKGRLKANIHYWKQTLQANSYIIDVIENGYKIPFFSKPQPSILSNNHSALAERDFVCEAIQSLLQRGLIEKCRDIPYVVNPLSVSVQSSGKKRLILDLREVNRHIWKQTIKYEDLRIALSYIEKDYWMIKWDIHSAYHFIEVYYPHTEFLGFSWPDKDGVVCYYKFLVLAFGLRTAPYLFSKVVRPLVSKWRGEGKKVIMYLDDGFGCGQGKQYMQSVSQDIKNDLLLSGFVPKVDKSLWEPVQEMTWLGAVLNSVECVICIPQTRIDKLVSSVNDLLSLLQKKRYVHVRSVASVVGQLISMSIVIGSVSQIMTRNLSIDILKARTWNSYIRLSNESMNQLLFWKQSLSSINSRVFTEVYITSKMIFSDASSTGYGGYEVNTKNGVVHGMWTKEERLCSSTWRELCAVQRTLKALKSILANQRVKWFTDNKNICQIVKKGSMKVDLQAMALDIFRFCSTNCIFVEIEWIPRLSNERADYTCISKIVEKDDWGISLDIL